MHFPNHPTGPLPVGEGPTGVRLVIPRGADAATTDLLAALLAVDPAKRPTTADALQVGFGYGRELGWLNLWLVKKMVGCMDGLVG